MADHQNRAGLNRRDLLRAGARVAAVAALAGIAGVTVKRARSPRSHWQLDPEKCTQCGLCATSCVLSPSAVKCVHAFDVCGYCDLCGGYHLPNTKTPDTAAENRLCPTGALNRKFIEEPYYEYTINEALCIGCGRCVKGCSSFGNGSLYLQVRHDRCANCNDCSIARACPGEAFKRVPANAPYILKGKQKAASA